MRRSLFIFVALFCGSVLTENIPSDSANYAYASTTNPDVAPRAAAYWTLKATDGAYPAETNSKGNPPSGVVFDSAKSMYSGPGVEAHERATSGQDEADTSVRFAGEEGGCLKFTGFESSYDSCLKNPLQCTLTDATNNNAQGFSMSMWINLPQDFNTEPRYILDTGGDEKGSPGIAVYFTGSVDGRQFTHQITVLVSTGAKFWKVVLNGMTKPYAWNNIGIRWSGQTESDSSVIPFGLQVFVNKTSVAWKRYETANTGSAVSNVDAADVVVTLGCKLDGTNTLIGQIDNLAIWYWRLRDSAGGTQKPDTEAKRGQINYFDSTLTFATTDVHVDMDTQEPDMKDTKPLYDKIPWMYTDELMRLRGLNALNTGYLDDVYPAKEGDCRVADPTTWGDGGDDDKPHPVDCADTRTELQAALEMDDEYSGHELAKAIVRVANKAGPDGLGYDDIVYLCDVAVPKSAAKIGAQVTIDHISVGLTYVNLIFALSKLQESVYDGLWKTKMATDKLVGVTDLMIKLDGYLAALTSKYYLTAISSDPALTYTAANNSAVAVVKTRPRDVKNDFLFPDYNLEYTNSDHMRVKFYDFPTKRQESWGRVTDYITFPKSAVVAGYKNTGKEIIMIGKINNKLHDIIPAVIDDRVEGIEGLEFFVNSRILSFTGTPLDKPGVMVTEPITYFVEHVKRQDDQPYRKGAILCVAWGFNEIDSTKLGAWDPDGCSLLETNDTHSLCQCSHMTDFALLMEDHQPVGRMSDVFYYVCYALYGISLLCLIIFMCIIIMAESLHYEVHIVHFNVAAAMFFAIGLYLLTLLANGNRVPCIIVSFFMHYSYSSAYAWCCICSHYVFRAVTTGKLGGKILGYYCYIGWGLPALIVITLAIIDVTRYGIGDRCLGAHNGYFLWIYIGIFLFLCAFVCPMFVVGIVNLNKLHINDATDRSDVTWSLFGTAAYWPIIMLVWVMAMLVYLIPQENQFFDFAFELFNSLQGILIFILIGMLVPSFRKAILSCGRRDDDAAARTEERIQARRKLYVPYFH